MPRIRLLSASILALLLVTTVARAQDTLITLARGNSLLQARNFPEAIKVFTALTAREPGNGRAWHQLGMAYYSTQDYNAALAANLRASEIPSSRPAALYNAGLMYALIGQKDSAFVFLMRAKATGQIDVTQISGDSDAVSLRADPRYQKLFPTAEEYADPFVEPVTILAEWRSEAAGDQFGWIARNAGDLDGDRIADVVTSSPTSGEGGPASGKVYVYSTRTRKLLWSRTGEAGQRLGFVVESAGDVNRDGVPDVVASARGAERAFVFSGKNGSTLLTLRSPQAGDGFGGPVSDLGDINRDGFDDVIVGAPLDDGGGTDAGKVYIFSGRDGSILQTLTGTQPNGRFGSAVAGGTVNGVTWIVAGAVGAGPRNSGRTFIFSGLETTPRFTIEADSTGVALGGMFVSVVGDVNQDGVADFYSADSPNSARGPRTGRVYIHSGRDGSRLLTLTGDGPGEAFGIGPSDAGDVNRDGYDDLAVGAWQFAGAAPSGGRIYVISGRDGSRLRTITGKVPAETLGFDSTGLGDVNGDGVPDLLVTSAWSSINGLRSGRVYVISGK
jgi:hypothetical protein